MDRSWNDKKRGYYSIYENRHLQPGLPLLKKLERAKLIEIYDTIENQECEQRFQGKVKSQLQGRMWEWQGDDGTWQPFEPEEQLKLENAMAMRQKTVPLVDSIHFMHTADLARMELVNMKNGSGKKMRRFANFVSGGKSSRRQGGVHTDAFSSREVQGWQFSDSSGDEACSRDVQVNEGIDCLGSTTLLPSVRMSGISAWSRHRSNRIAGHEANPNISFKLGRVSLEDKTAVRKRVRQTSRDQVSSKIRTKAKNAEMAKLKKWLQKVGLEEYYEKFRRERISLKEMHALNDQDLVKIGLPIGARKRLFDCAKDLKVAREPPNEYLCPITMALMKEPVLLGDGFTYEKSAIEKWLKESNSSPLTNEVLGSDVLTPNRQLKKLIEDFKAMDMA